MHYYESAHPTAGRRRDVSGETAPEPFASVIDAVAKRDRLWFAAYRDANELVRPIASGEFWPKFPAGTQVRVRQLAPGRRARKVLP